MDPKIGDTVFVDTNVLLTATDIGRPHHQEAQQVIAGAGPAGIHLALSGQILREYLAVATRPIEANGLGLIPADAAANAEEFLRHTVFYEETEDVSARLRDLTRSCGLVGKHIHDGNVAATMLVYGLSLLLTQNPGDFGGMPEIHPVTLVALARQIADAHLDSGPAGGSGFPLSP